MMDLKIKKVKWDLGVYLEPLQGTDEEPFTCKFLYHNKKSLNNGWAFESINNAKETYYCVVDFSGNVKTFEKSVERYLL